MVSIDLGASTARVAVGKFDGQRLQLSEVKRSPNVPVHAEGRLYWDVLRLYGGILDGLAELGSDRGAGPVASVGVDGWGVDFALVDSAGHLLGNPVHYRDSRTGQAFARTCDLIPPREIFGSTGAQMLSINTLYQLVSLHDAGDPALAAAARMLMVPDLFHYWLSGVAAQEWTEATTTQCYDLANNDWAWRVIERIGLPERLFGETVPSGTLLGTLRAEVGQVTGMREAQVVAGATHDTASAIAAVPFEEDSSLYISSGTWSVMGAQVPVPVIDDYCFAANLTNEGGPYGTTQLMSNLTGLWLLQECERAWARSPAESAVEVLMAMAQQAPPMRSLVNPNAAAFIAPGDMPGRIAAACGESGQQVPEDRGSLVRCILESLALAYRQTAELIGRVSGHKPRAVHIVGGGSLNSLLCQWTADATGLPVWAGPCEASQIGNLLVQATALGELGSPQDAREVVQTSFPPVLYEPGDRQLWDDAADRFVQLCG